MNSSLTNEHYIVIPASLAATLGLEAAALLQIIGDLQRFNGSQTVLTIPQKRLRELTPFWDEMQLRNILNSLQAKGILEATFSGDNLILASPQIAPPKVVVAKVSKPTSSAVSAMTIEWQPRHSTYDSLIHNHGIPKSFAAEQLDEFCLYWQDRQTTTFSWDSKFLRHVIKAWKTQPAPEKPSFTPIEQEKIPLNGEWQPSLDAIEILENSGVDKDYIRNAIPEFILYWRERGDSHKTWNSKFVGHIRRQWARFSSAQIHDTDPHRITADWQPVEDAYDIIVMANIDRSFAEQQIAAFVLFWRESNQLHKSWNAKFLQHVKYNWAKQHQIQNESANQSTSGRDAKGFVEKHTDASWRKGI